MLGNIIVATSNFAGLFFWFLLPNPTMVQTFLMMPTMVFSFLFHLCDSREGLLKGINIKRKYITFFLYGDRLFVALGVVYLLNQLLYVKLPNEFVFVLIVALACWIYSDQDLILGLLPIGSMRPRKLCKWEYVLVHSMWHACASWIFYLIVSSKSI